MANGLIALRLAQFRPNISVAIVAVGGAVGGNHVWSSFDDDLTVEQRAWIEPLIAHRWQEYSVRFPNGVRTLRGVSIGDQRSSCRCGGQGSAHRSHLH